MIQVNEVTKQYDNGFVAVDHLNLHVHDGDIYGYLGPNGAGKTTTIRMLNTLVSPTNGDIYVAGLNTKKSSKEIRKIIGVLPESHGYYDWMTGRAYLTLFAELFGVEKMLIKERVNTVLDLVGMIDKADVLLGQYSRGMKQRIGIAKTIVHEPKLIFLDEPTLGLDPQGQRDIQNIILDLNKKNGVTIFITSHLLKEIGEICNRVAIVKKGKLVEENQIDRFMMKYKGIVSANPTIEDIFFYLTTDHDQEVR